MYECHQLNVHVWHAIIINDQGQIKDINDKLIQFIACGNYFTVKKTIKNYIIVASVSPVRLGAGSFQIQTALNC